MNLRRDKKEREQSSEEPCEPRFQRRYNSWTIENVLPGVYEFGKGKFSEVAEAFAEPPKITVAQAELGRAVQITTTGFAINWNGMGEKPKLTVTITA